MYWATVLYFTKSDEARLLFGIMNSVKKNWEYYGKLYKFPQRTYRNDYAVSIALHMLRSKQERDTQYELPYKIMCIADKNMLKSNYSFIFNHKGKLAGSNFTKQSIHVMNKESAMELSQRVLNG